MSAQEITAFFKKVSDDSNLEQRVQEALEKRPEAAAFEIVDIAAANDCSFTATELREYLAAVGSDVELTDDQLAGAAGGLRMLSTIDLAGLRKLGSIEPSLLRARRMDLDKRML